MKSNVHFCSIYICFSLILRWDLTIIVLDQGTIYEENHPYAYILLFIYRIGKEEKDSSVIWIKNNHQNNVGF